LAEVRTRLQVYRVGDRVAVFAPQGSALIQRVDAMALAGAGEVAEGGLAAPMPGKVISLLASAGQTVKKGQAVAVMEAMKMEHTLYAPRDGTVAEVLYAVGDQVMEGGALMRLVAE
jgi:3-methylcrotonyl-CoA carboxylase alpha subunit